MVALSAQAQAPEADIALEEVVVTARKREENLQDVPLAVTAFRAEELQRVGIKDIEGIISRDPSLGFDRGIAPYDTRIVIRGLSPTRGRPNVRPWSMASMCRARRSAPPVGRCSSTRAWWTSNASRS